MGRLDEGVIVGLFLAFTALYYPIFLSVLTDPTNTATVDAAFLASLIVGIGATLFIFIISEISNKTKDLPIVVRLPEPDCKAQYEYWLNVTIGMVAGLITSIAATLAYEYTTIAAFFLFAIIILGAIVVIVKLIVPLYFEKYSSTVSIFIGIGLGTGLVTGVGSIALFRHDYITFLAVIIIVIVIIAIMLKKRKNQYRGC